MREAAPPHTAIPVLRHLDPEPRPRCGACMCSLEKAGRSYDVLRPSSLPLFRIQSQMRLVIRITRMYPRYLTRTMRRVATNTFVAVTRAK